MVILVGKADILEGISLSNHGKHFFLGGGVLLDLTLLKEKQIGPVAKSISFQLHLPVKLSPYQTSL